MYNWAKLRYKCVRGIGCRYLSSAEISTALRPFYFSVHPDLFGKYPEQRKTNENSLQQLSALIEAQQLSQDLTVPPLSFYLRQKNVPPGEFKLIKVTLNGKNVRETIVKVLKACDLSTSFVDKLPSRGPSIEDVKAEFKKAMKRYQQDLAKVSTLRWETQKKKANENLIEWLQENTTLAKQKYDLTEATRDQVTSIMEHLQKTYGLKEIKYDSGWNISHIRGALQSLVSLANQHSSCMSNLEGRVLALGQFTGVSLDGDVYFSIIDVRNEWLSLIKKVSQEDKALSSIPDYEKALSGVLRDIHIRRRKFMPKVSATQYCSHLRQLLTSVGDFYGAGKQFPASVPKSLSKYEIVVEPEAGPLMVSPTGQFTTPSSCPAEQLINFIAAHLDDATLLLTEYSINKHVEKALFKEVKERFGLLELHKDDSVTPALMILCCQRLLTRTGLIKDTLQGNILNITNYYSVLSEGTLCIPWNFK